MRIAPVALYSSYNVDELRSNVQNVSRLTHINSEAINGAMAVAFAIASAVNGQLRPHSIIGETIDFLGATEMSSKLKEVEALLKRSELTIEQGLGQLGTRGYVLESVGSAFYAFLKTPLDFCKSLVNAINAGGDTDSIGSLTGAISGAFNGINSIPTKWINNLEDKNRLDEYSCRLYRLTEARQPLS